MSMRSAGILPVKPMTRAASVRRIYQTEGWIPTATLSLLDNPRHKEIRTIFQHALRAGKIRELEPRVTATADDLVEAFLADGRCDVVRQFCVPLPLLTMCGESNIGPMHGCAVSA